MTITKTGVLLINLGTPTRATKPAVRAFLQEFLSDERVIDIPAWQRQILLHAIILPFRTGKTTHAYQAIWDSAQGSPLLYHSQQLQQKLQQQLGVNYQVELGMRYGQPDLTSAIDNLVANRCAQVVIAPLFPQYSSAATGSALEKVLALFQHRQIIPNLRVISDFFDSHPYISAQAKLIAPYIDETKPDHILLSYHSLPWRQIKKSASICESTCEQNSPCPAINNTNRNCYRAQCFATSRLLAEQLNVSNFDVVFQSRLGKIPWIGPDLTATMQGLIQQGKKNLLIASPSFTADCLETLEEIGIRARELWLELGGERFTLVPCLNANQAWVQGLACIITA